MAGYLPEFLCAAQASSQKQQGRLFEEARNAGHAEMMWPTTPFSEAPPRCLLAHRHCCTGFRLHPYEANGIIRSAPSPPGTSAASVATVCGRNEYTCVASSSACGAAEVM